MSVSDFYIILYSDLENMKKLSSEKQLFSKETAVKYSAEGGEKTPYLYDSALCRRVLVRGGKEHQISCLDLDSGEDLYSKEENLYHLTEGMKQILPLAINCALDGSLFISPHSPTLLHVFKTMCSESNCIREGRMTEPLQLLTTVRKTRNVKIIQVDQQNSKVYNSKFIE